jgi:hypothetical protein
MGFYPLSPDDEVESTTQFPVKTEVPPMSDSVFKSVLNSALDSVFKSVLNSVFSGVFPSILGMSSLSGDPN